MGAQTHIEVPEPLSEQEYSLKKTSTHYVRKLCWNNELNVEIIMIISFQIVLKVYNLIVDCCLSPVLKLADNAVSDTNK